MEMIADIASFMHNSNFLWSDIPTLDYVLNILNPPYSRQILVYNDNTIVGCNFFIYARTRIKDDYKTIAWSNSTFLDPIYRRYVGLDFILSIYECENVMGFGVTDINYKLLTMLHANFIATSYGFKLKNEYYNSGISNPILSYPSDLFVKDKHFIKVNSSSEIRAPKDGSWNQDMEIDFIRDEDFINKRFFKTPWHYLIYRLPGNGTSLDELYFICRIRNNKGIRTLFLVDYRFNVDSKMGMDYVIEALYQLCVLNNIKESLIFTSLTSQINTANRVLEKFGEDVHLISNITGINPNSIMVTPADSDCDLIPLNS